MTIRFLNDWNGYKAGQTRTLSAAEETAALGARVAVDAVAAPASPVEVRFDPATSSLLGPDGKPVSAVSGAGNPGYLWINRPTPTASTGEPGSAGNVIRITDIGPTGAGSLWISDGTVWRTLNGSQVLSSRRSGAPGAALATATSIAKLALPAGSMVSGGSIALPVGLMRVDTGLRASIMMRHTGTAGTFSAALRFGTLNTSSDNSFASCQGAASNDIAAWAFSEASLSGTTTFVAKFLVAPNGATNTPQNRITNFDIAQPLYLGLYVSALTAPDTLELLDYSIEFQD